MSWFKRHPKTTWFSLGAVIAILLAAGLVNFVDFHGRSKQEAAQGDGSGGGKQHEAAPVRVKVIYPKEGGVERLVRRPATVQSFEFADLASKVTGFLKNQDHREGQPPVDIGYKAKKGEVLAEVYAPELFKAVEKAGADLKKARANVTAAQARVNKAQADEEAAQSRYEQSKSDVKKAKAVVSLRNKQYERFKGLVAAKSIQQELLDEKLEALLASQAAETAAEKAVNTAQSEVVSAKAGIAQANADVLDAEAAVSVAKAQLDQAEVWAKYTQIVSPYDGVVTKRNYHDGDPIQDFARPGSKAAAGRRSHRQDAHHRPGARSCRAVPPSGKSRHSHRRHLAR